jgi:hypothetical protein
LGFYNRFFDDPFFEDVAQSFDIKMLIFNEKNALIEQSICKTRLKLKKARLGYQVKVTTNQPIAPHARF